MSYTTKTTTDTPDTWQGRSFANVMWKTWFLVSLLVVVSASSQNVNNEPGDGKELDLLFDPPSLMKVVEGTHHLVTWYTNLTQVNSVHVQVQDQMVSEAQVLGAVIRGDSEDNATFYGQINVSALFIGYNKIRLTLHDQENNEIGEGTLSMSVLLSYQNINDLFTLVIGILVAIVYVNMGATMDFEVIKKVSKKPVGPLLGITCQYLFMPLIAFALGQLAFPNNATGQLGLFLMGCSPGGGLSNMWTHILGGSLDLSIMMTFFSTVTAFAALPLWVLLLGRVIMKDAEFVIPYIDIVTLVFSLSVPCIIGLLIQKYLPRVAKVLECLLTPLSVFNLIFIFTFGVYANRYIFRLFDWTILIAGFGLPALGYLSGMMMAKLFKRSTKDTIAISVETGLQNGTVAVFILKFTLEKPAGDLSIVFPGASVIMTPVPLLVALVVRHLYVCYVRSKEKTDEPKDSKPVEMDTSSSPALESETRETKDATTIVPMTTTANATSNSTVSPPTPITDAINTGTTTTTDTITTATATNGTHALRSDSGDGGIDNPAVDLEEGMGP